MNREDILIVCALEQETVGKLDGYDVLYTGVGKVNATYKLTRFLPLNFHYDLIINYGTGASKSHSGLVDCTQFIQRDMDASGLGFPKGMTPFCPPDGNEYIIDFSHIKNPIGKNYVCGTGDNFVEDISNEMDDIDVFDMEAYALAKTCRNFGKDFVSYKYISDDGNADDWKENCSKGINEFKKVLEYYDNS